MKIAISSGHGKHVSGAVGIINEVYEARRVVSCVASHLKQLGVAVAEFHDDTSRNQRDNINTIVAWHNAQDADLNISVHFNAFEPTQNARGIEVLYRTEIRTAAKVSQAISDISGLRNRGAKHRTNLGFLNSTNRPAILIEVCFVDSQTDADLYRSKYNEICTAISHIVSGVPSKSLCNAYEDFQYNDKSEISLEQFDNVPKFQIKTAQSLGIIKNTAKHWSNVTNIKYLSALFSNFTQNGVCDARIDNGVDDLNTALEILQMAGIMQSPEYWRNLVDAGTPHLSELLISISNRCRIVLERIVHAEARGESLKGQALVANVVLNRHNNKTFPNGIHNVVFQARENVDGTITHQFTPIADGSFENAIPSDSVKQAVINVLNGSDESRGALFFCTLASFYHPNSWHANNLQVLLKYGNHVFFR